MGGLCAKATNVEKTNGAELESKDVVPGAGAKKDAKEVAGSTANISLKKKEEEAKSETAAAAPAAALATPDAGGAQKTPSSAAFKRDLFIASGQGQIDDHYKVKEAIGTGSYGTVSIAIDKKTGSKKACKTIQHSKVTDKEKLNQEIDIMRRLDHPSIARLFETFQDMRNIYLIMELCSGGELFDKVIDADDCHFTEKTAAIVMRQIIAGIVYMHAHHICHRDLKPENFLMMDDGDVADTPLKIIDFGLSADFSQTEWLKTKACTPYYVAPEVLSGKYKEGCDVWSAGVIMYVLLCGAPPFFGDTDAEVLTSVRKGHYEFDLPVWDVVSREAKDLVQRMLVLDPTKRYTAQDALNHKWIQHLAPQSKGALPFSANAFRNLKKFRQNHKLKKAALTIVAHNIDEAQISDLRKMFMAMDKDSDGTLTITEIKEGMANAKMKIPSNIDEILKDIDSDGSGEIDYSEFLAATMEQKAYVKEEVCWAAFRVFDIDGNGKITKDELAAVLSGEADGGSNVESMLGMDLTEIDEIIKEVDTDGDGEIDFEEFMTMIRSNAGGEKDKDGKMRRSTASGGRKTVTATDDDRHPLSPQPEKDLGVGVIL